MGRRQQRQHANFGDAVGKLIGLSTRYPLLGYCVGAAFLILSAFITATKPEKGDAMHSLALVLFIGAGGVFLFLAIIGTIVNLVRRPPTRHAAQIVSRNGTSLPPTKVPTSSAPCAPVPAQHPGAPPLIEHPTAIPSPMPYRPKSRLLSKGEKAFWHPLYHAVKGKYRIFCKVQLSEIVAAPKHRKDERRWFRKIRGYHVDFVICDPQTTEPLLVIELDDKSHRRTRTCQRDQFKNEVLAAAAMPLYRQPCQQAYDPIEIAARIEQLIGG